MNGTIAQYVIPYAFVVQWRLCIQNVDSHTPNSRPARSVVVKQNSQDILPGYFIMGLLLHGTAELLP